MSRGSGKIQQAVLEALEADAPCGTTVETMRWKLYESSSGRKNETDGMLPNRWNTSFARAVDGLAKRKRISVVKRKLENFDQCVEHYPGKTLKAQSRMLRATLLPTLQAWIKDRIGLTPKYGAAENESYHLRSLPENALNEMRSAWIRLENLLRPVYGKAPDHSDDLLRLICRGRYLFGRGDIIVHEPLADLINQGCLNATMPVDLKGELRGFLESFMPSEQASVLKFRSYIHQLAEVPTSNGCLLQKETLVYLHQRHGQLVEGLPGFKQKREGIWQNFGKPEIVYPPDIKHLFDHTVFQNFKFIALLPQQ